MLKERERERETHKIASSGFPREVGEGDKVKKERRDFPFLTYLLLFNYDFSVKMYSVYPGGYTRSC